MKFIRTEKSSKDGFTDVYVFKMGKDELVILNDMLNHHKKHTPHSFFTMPFTSRINAMQVEIAKTMRQFQLGMYSRIKGGWSIDPIHKGHEEVL